MSEFKNSVISILYETTGKIYSKPINPALPGSKYYIKIIARKCNGIEPDFVTYLTDNNNTVYEKRKAKKFDETEALQFYHDHQERQIKHLKDGDYEIHCELEKSI